MAHDATKDLPPMYFDEEAVTQEVLDLLMTRYRAIHRMLYDADPPTQETPANPELRTCIHQLVTYANGGPTSPEECAGREAVENCVEDVVLVLLACLFHPAGYPWRRDQWLDYRNLESKAQLARLIEVIEWDVYGRQEAITYTEAAAILYDDYERITRNTAVKRIHRLIARGELEGYRDPREPNPRHAQRVRRSDVDSMRMGTHLKK